MNSPSTNTENKYLRGTCNFDKTPVVKVEGARGRCYKGWSEISEILNAKLRDLTGKSGSDSSGKTVSRKVLLVECYPGVHQEQIIEALRKNFQATFFISNDYFKSEAEIDTMVAADVTDDEIFGYMSRLKIKDFFDPQKLLTAREEIAGIDGLVVIVGPGSSVLCQEPTLLVYADMARWEIQQRFRKNLVGNLGANNKELKTGLQYKRAYFVDWRVCDRLKKELINKWDYFLDTNSDEAKLVEAEDIRQGLREAAQRPFRVVPFFDPGPWGGQWMKEICDLDRQTPNFAWCFDCVPEENSLLFSIDNTVIELPSINLVFFQAQNLLGRAVQARFGDEFPIRFDFLDTMDGGNLSLQVHPTTEYIQESFGMHYTQDESYYMLDAGSDACVYLGLKENINPEEMIHSLNRAQEGDGPFDAEKFVEKWSAKKHDHFLIPAGTIHCSGANSMVLEISSTPYIFTFKLWDWNRMGLDGKPRPINIEHGRSVIDWTRKKSWVEKELVNAIQPVAQGDGWVEEKTGLHEREFIETRRHWFSKPVTHHTNGSVNVLNLVEGKEAIVESPSQAFKPFVVHYAETFIIPESVKEYTVRPFGESEGQQCATIKAFVRVNP